MRVLFEKDCFSFLIRLMGKNYGGERAYLSLRLCGPELEIEFPSDWHEERRGWVRIGFLFGVFAFSFPWNKVVPDEGQCSGPRYGFQFHADLLWIHHGKSTGRPRDGSTTTINMPWQWKHKWHTIDTTPSDHPYRYVLRNGTVQDRIATIQIERRHWERYWIPWSKTIRSIDVKFSGEVGEKTGSWKGGTIGCGYNMLPLEGASECLRRMELEWRF